MDSHHDRWRTFTKSWNLTSRTGKTEPPNRSLVHQDGPRPHADCAIQAKATQHWWLTVTGWPPSRGERSANLSHYQQFLYPQDDGRTGIFEEVILTGTDLVFTPVKSVMEVENYAVATSQSRQPRCGPC